MVWSGNNLPEQMPIYQSDNQLFDYLQLHRLLTAQHPRSNCETGKLAHDEHFFIVIHQSEY